MQHCVAHSAPGPTYSSGGLSQASSGCLAATSFALQQYETINVHLLHLCFLARPGCVPDRFRDRREKGYPRTLDAEFWSPAIIAAFLLPHLPVFHFLNFAPVTPVLSSIGVILCTASMTFLVLYEKS